MNTGRLGKFFRKSKAESLLLFSPEERDSNFFYITGLLLDNTYFLAGDDGTSALLVNRINETEAKGTGLDVLVWKDSQDFWRKAGEFYRGCKSISVDTSSLSAGAYIRISKKLWGKRILSGTKTLLAQRAVKEEGEISLVRKAAVIARSIVGGADVSPGRTELAISRDLKISALEAGVGLSFEPIVVSGKSSAMPHGKSGTGKVSSGNVVLIDFGVRYKGYCSDITRCFFIGKCPEERERYGKLKEVFLELVAGVKPGAECRGVPGHCNKLMGEQGLGEIVHSPGHGIGLDVHEVPPLSKKSREMFVSGMTLAIEPAFYCPGKYGLRYEDDIVIANGRAKIL